MSEEDAIEMWRGWLRRANALFNEIDAAERAVRANGLEFQKHDWRWPDGKLSPYHIEARPDPLGGWHVHTDQTHSGNKQWDHYETIAEMASIVHGRVQLYLNTVQERRDLYLGFIEAFRKVAIGGQS